MTNRGSVDGLPAEADVVVVGSGGAGLTAALAAAIGGASVVVLEGSARWGGTTGVSGGQVWVPGNHHMAGAGLADSYDDALTYCLGLAPDRDRDLIEAFLRAAPQMARFVEAHSALRFAVCGVPDSFAERPGGRAAGRHLEPLPVAMAGVAAHLQVADDELAWPSSYPMVLTNDEIGALDLIAGGAFPVELIEERLAAGETCMGLGLIVGLLRGCVAAGVTLARSTPVTRLLRDGQAGRVTGVAVASGEIAARRGVVLACGGFEWDAQLVARHLGPRAARPVSPPVNRGSNLRLAGAAGAELARTGEVWSWPVLGGVADAWPEGSPRPRMLVAERGRPHVIWVDASGRRFVNESSHNVALALTELDPAAHRLRNQPAWIVGDARYRERSPIAGAPTGEPAPGWLVEAATLAELAESCHIDAERLAVTVERFNRMADAGRDDDFGRGSALYDRANGDAGAAHPNLGTIEKPPFFALAVEHGAVGTKGGPRTDASGRVVSWSGSVIDGLYAAGNAMAAVIGPGTIAPGITLGMALTWGWIAGRVLAGVDGRVGRPPSG